MRLNSEARVFLLRTTIPQVEQKRKHGGRGAARLRLEVRSRGHYGKIACAFPIHCLIQQIGRVRLTVSWQPLPVRRVRAPDICVLPIGHDCSPTWVTALGTSNTGSEKGD